MNIINSVFTIILSVAELDCMPLVLVKPTIANLDSELTFDTVQP